MYRGLMPQTIQGGWPLVLVTRLRYVTPLHTKEFSKRRSGGGVKGQVLTIVILLV
jgi:hypothetical protein